jgi:hypothetical protein
MRILGCLLVLFALLLSVGGVVVRSSAEPEMSLLPEGVTDDVQGICPYRNPEPVRRTMTMKPRPRDKGDVRFTLNSKGYNYTRPGEYRPPVPPTAAAPPAASE